MMRCTRIQLQYIYYIHGDILKTHYRSYDCTTFNVCKRAVVWCYIIIKYYTHFLVEPNIHSVITKQLYVELRIEKDENKKSYTNKYQIISK